MTSSTNSSNGSRAASSVLSRPEKERAFLRLAEAFRNREPSLLDWSAAVRFERGQPLDFATFPFQVELYEAFGDRNLQTVDVIKSAQCGISAAGVSAALYAADIWRAHVLYVMPSDRDVWDFSDTRIKPSIEDSIYLGLRVASTDNKGLKRIGDANVYFRGSVSESNALSIPADVLFLDEYDRLTQVNVPKFRKRLGSPTSLKLERRFSNPSYPEAGIHALYLDSDQRSWSVRCPSCGVERPTTWATTDAGNHFVDEGKPDDKFAGAIRRCGGCRKPIDGAAVAAGRWVARYPDRPRGYQISKLDVPNESIPDLVAEHRKTDEDSVTAHYNFDLGLPYAPRGGSLDREAVLACRRNYRPPTSYSGEDWVTAGVDVGAVLHVRISRWMPNGLPAPLYLGTVDSFDDLAQLWARYDVNFGVIDERPEERAARAFVLEHIGRAMLTRWAGDDQRDPIVIDEDRLLLVARRTAACDRLVANVQAQKRYLGRDVPAEYVSQMTAPHRVVEKSRGGQKIARYVSERDDHFFFAEMYDMLAREARSGEYASGSVNAPTTIRERVRAR